jgi:hypothetical protein
MLVKRLNLEIAEIVVCSVAHGEDSFYVEDGYLPFTSEHEPDLLLTGHYGYLPEAEREGQRVFQNDRTYACSQDDQGWIWRFRCPSLDPIPRRLGFFSFDFRAGEVFFNDVAEFEGTLPMPLHHPLDKFLYTTLLADRSGIMLHACGISLEGHGLLFVGESGTGKSTMGVLWSRQPGVTVLSDERVAVRDLLGRFWLYGTPWHGTARLCSDARSPLQALLLLKQGRVNQAVRLSPMRAISQLAACVYWPAWSRRGMQNVLKVTGNLVQQVPCFELTFCPGSQVIEYLNAELLESLQKA